MGNLIDMLPLPEKRSQLVGECCELLDLEVRKKKGISGLTIKAGYTILKSFKPGAIYHAIDALLDDFIDELDELHQEYKKNKPKESFGRFMKNHSNQVAKALVGVTDHRAEQSQHATLKKGYQKLRPYAVRSVEDAAYGLADLMDRYYKA